MRSGTTIRVYWPSPYRGAYVYIEDGRVTHASEALAFTIGWPRSKVVERASAVGFRTCTNIRITSPNPNWLSKNPKTKANNNVD